MQTLNEMLIDLQLFKSNSIDLCRPIGNALGEARWRITWMQTAGGEQFCFKQVDYLGNAAGSGFYFRDILEAEAYARECVKRLFSTSTAILRGSDPTEYDWHPRGGLAEF